MPGKPRHQDHTQRRHTLPFSMLQAASMEHVRTDACKNCGRGAHLLVCRASSWAGISVGFRGVAASCRTAARFRSACVDSWGVSGVHKNQSQESRSTSMPGTALGKASDTDVDAVCWRLLTQFDGSRR